MHTIKFLGPSDRLVLEYFLSRYADTSMFLRSNLRRVGLKYEGKPFEGVYVAALEDGEIVGVAAHYWNDNIILQLPGAYADKILRVIVEQTQRPVKGLIGPFEQVQQARVILNLSDSPTRYANREKLYTLSLADLIVPEQITQNGVTCRNVSEADLSWLIDWRVGFMVEALRDTNTPELRERCLTEERARLTHGDAWLLEDAGLPVAYSNFNARLPDMVQIGGVWTPPELRCRGYARCVVAGSLLKACEKGVSRAILFTEEHNISAQKAYETIGFRHVGEYSIVLFQHPANSL
jgi:predicted GNAT family acetyltransferase